MAAEQSASSVKQRHPLGLPKGSVRALLALSVFGSLMGVLLQGQHLPETTFWYLWMVNYAVLAYYFANRQRGHHAPSAESGEHAPLRLPKGTVRWLIILSFLATAGYLGLGWYEDPDRLWKDKNVFPMIALGGFFLGRVFQALFQPDPGKQVSGLVQRIQDGKALLSLSTAAVVVLTVLVSVQLPAQDAVQRFCFVYIIFYFGSRS